MRLTSSIIGIVAILVLGLAAAADTAAAERTAPIIADHTSTDLDAIPQEWIEAAKDQLRACYGHTSHGSQPVHGMALLMVDPENNGLYDFNIDGAVTPGVLSLVDRTPSFDIGWGDGDFHERTRDYLDDDGSGRNLVIWSWCGQVSLLQDIHVDEYLNRMVQLETEYPDVDFVYMTGHLDGTGAEGNLHLRNEQIRDFCRANNKILFDFADIESYDPDGNGFLELYADDACDYDDGNWAEEWCAANPGSLLCDECDCAHSDSLNCNLKAQAFWWMLARIAGWEPEVPQTVACDLVCQPAAGTLPLLVRFNATLTNRYPGFVRRVTGRVDVELPGGNRIIRWRAGTTNLEAGESLPLVWGNLLPASPTMVGQSTFTLVGIDVTPVPFNQPPYPPSGDSDSANCSVTGAAP